MTTFLAGDRPRIVRTRRTDSRIVVGGYVHYRARLGARFIGAKGVSCVLSRMKRKGTY